MGGKKLGVLGGTFNPIHSGHLHLALQARRLFGLTEIHFVVAALPPHKSHTGLTSLLHRYAMVCLATAGSDYYIPSLIELEPPESPFTVDTLRKMERLYGDAHDRPYFLAGGDSLREVATWRESERLLSTARFVFFMRPGVILNDPAELLPSGTQAKLVDLRGLGSRALSKAIHQEEESAASRIYIIHSGAPDISSTRIREHAAAGRNLGALVPAPVQRYIHKMKLYGEK